MGFFFEIFDILELKIIKNWYNLASVDMFTLKIDLFPIVLNLI